MYALWNTKTIRFGSVFACLLALVYSIKRKKRDRHTESLQMFLRFVFFLFCFVLFFFSCVLLLPHFKDQRLLTRAPSHQFVLHTLVSIAKIEQQKGRWTKMPHAPSGGHVEPRITAERSMQTESRMFVNYPVLHQGRCTLPSKPPTHGWPCWFKVASQRHGRILNMPPVCILCVFVCVSLNRMSPASTTSWSRCCWYSRISVWAEGWLTWPRTRPWTPSSAVLVRGITDPLENKSIMFWYWALRLHCPHMKENICHVIKVGL